MRAGAGSLGVEIRGQAFGQRHGRQHGGVIRRSCREQIVIQAAARPATGLAAVRDFVETVQGAGLGEQAFFLGAGFHPRQEILQRLEGLVVPRADDAGDGWRLIVHPRRFRPRRMVLSSITSVCAPLNVQETGSTRSFRRFASWMSVLTE